VLALLLALWTVKPAFTETPMMLKLKNGVGRLVVKGEVSGEQHDTYAIELESGRTIRITVSSKKGKVNFSVCDSDEYSTAEPVTFGKRSADSESWEGVIPVAKIYYIYVTAYPEAKYTLLLQAK